MAENEIAVEENVDVEVTTAPQEEKPQKEPFKAKAKEWWRKKVVGLKRKPQTIALVVLLLSTIVYLCSLGTLSKTVYFYVYVNWLGLPLFISNLFSILVLLLFLYTFPKRKKTNIVMLVMTFVFMAAMIACDAVFYWQLANAIKSSTESQIANNPYVLSAGTLVIVHIVLVGLSALLLATLPLYKKLLMKVNTRKDLESNNMTEEIDTSESEG